MASKATPADASVTLNFPGCPPIQGGPVITAIDASDTMTTCATCGGILTRSWGGWGHARKPERRHVVRPR